MQPWSMADAPVESGPFVARRSPGDRLGSYVYMVSRLHRMRRRFEGLSANSLNTPSHSSMNYLAMASRALGGPKRRRMRRRRLPTTRPTPRDLQEPICPRKKRAIWTRWHLVPGKNANYLRAPRIGVCGAGDYPLPDLPREAPRSRSTSEKSKLFGPDGAPFPSKTPITRGPPVVAVAVSLDPILPQR